MLLIILQLNLHFQVNNHPIRPPNAPSGDLGTESETESWLLLQQSYNYFLHFIFCFILIIPRLTELCPFKCQSHPVSLWFWHLTCNLEKCYSLIIMISPGKNFFGIIWDGIFISEFKLKLCLIFQNFQNGRYFELATIFFYRELYRKLNIPER